MCLQVIIGSERKPPSVILNTRHSWRIWPCFWFAASNRAWWWIWHSETRYCQGGEQRKTLQVMFGYGIGDKNGFGTVGNGEHKRLKSLAQHRAVFFAVVTEPSFPQSVGPNAVVGDVGFGVGDNVLDVLSRSQFDPTSKELLCGNRGNARLLIVAGLPRDALADDKFPDVHFAIRQTVFIVRKDAARDLKFLQIRVVIVCFGEDGEHFVLHSCK